MYFSPARRFCRNVPNEGVERGEFKPLELLTQPMKGFPLWSKTFHASSETSPSSFSSLMVLVVCRSKHLFMIVRCDLKHLLLLVLLEKNGWAGLISCEIIIDYHFPTDLLLVGNDLFIDQFINQPIFPINDPV